MFDHVPLRVADLADVTDAFGNFALTQTDEHEVAIRDKDVRSSAAFCSTIGPAAGLTIRRQAEDGAPFAVGASDGSFLVIAGEPGERPRYHDGYYALDPDGNNIEVVDHHAS